jgi:hypothetical protein
MIFALITFFAAFAIEGLGTLVSVIGLSSLFGANPIIIALAISLDIGKLVVVSLLYKHWVRLGTVMRSYALVAAVITMIITSAGAAGYLSTAFQQAIVGTQEGSLKVDVLKQQIAKYEERKKQIDAQIAAIPDRYSANQKIRLMAQFKAEQKDLQDKIAVIDKDLPALQIQQLNTEAHAGPILYIAKAFSIPVEQAVKYVILMIIFVFDPLAVFLIIAGNFLWDQRKNVEPIQATSPVILGLAAPEPNPITKEFIDARESKHVPLDVNLEDLELSPKEITPNAALIAAQPNEVPAEPATEIDSAPAELLVPADSAVHDDVVVPEAPPVAVEENEDHSPTVILAGPDTSETKVYTEEEVLELNPAMAEELQGPEELKTRWERIPRVHPERTVEERDQITLETLGVQKHETPTSSLADVKPDPATRVIEPVGALHPANRPDIFPQG